MKKTLSDKYRKIRACDDWELDYIRSLAERRSDGAIAFSTNCWGEVWSTGRYGCDRGPHLDLREFSDVLAQITDAFLQRRPLGGRFELLGRSVVFSDSKTQFAVIKR
ncbi:hypothetical protein ABZ477_03820 [Microbacterium sp. NPDC019599]|uniref:hypothetical protein n=1 Tax=Microbacterium sp. NPDC019599 TaxID=3154690 RepID=UPI0033D19692